MAEFNSRIVGIVHIDSRVSSRWFEKARVELLSNRFRVASQADAVYADTYRLRSELNDLFAKVMSGDSAS